MQQQEYAINIHADSSITLHDYNDDSQIDDENQTSITNHISKQKKITSTSSYGLEKSKRNVIKSVKSSKPFNIVTPQTDPRNMIVPVNKISNYSQESVSNSHTMIPPKKRLNNRDVDEDDSERYETEEENSYGEYYSEDSDEPADDHGNENNEDDIINEENNSIKNRNYYQVLSSVKKVNDKTSLVLKRKHYGHIEEKSIKKERLSINNGTSVTDLRLTTENNQHFDNLSASKCCEPFVRHMLDKGYYMYIVCKSENGKCKIFYANCVTSITNEYSGRYSNIDRYVLIVAYNRFRFMISYKLVLEMKLPIPHSEKFTQEQLNDRDQKCYFSEVQDFSFLTLLTNTFKLDIFYFNNTMSLLLSAIGEDKSAELYHHFNYLYQSGSVFNLPLATLRTEATGEAISISKNPAHSYVEEIIKYSKGIRYRRVPGLNIKSKNMSQTDKFIFIEKNLQFWIRGRDEKSAPFKVQDRFFSYKYSRVVRVLFETDRYSSKLYKIKMVVGDVVMVESFLRKSVDLPQLNCCVLVKTKNDERITIIKRGSEFIWITSLLKDINLLEMIDKFQKFNHYIFSLNQVTRKEANLRHNGLIKLISYYTGEFITMEETQSIADELFQCICCPKTFHS